MIVDLAESSLPEQTCDVCVIGSGAAGTVLATELDGTPLKVIVCESGGLDHEPATQALYDADITGLPFPGTQDGRFRVYGGTTTRWGGQALPLLPSDFQQRDWVPFSGWPISYETVEPFYSRAAKFLLIDDLDYDQQLYPHLRRDRAQVNARRVWHHFSKWSPRPDLRARSTPQYRASANVTLLLHANLIDLTLRPAHDGVESATFRSLHGAAVTVRAKRFVLCVGGIETARVLLANRSQQPTGLGNGHDRVGRFFQDHPGARVGVLRPTNDVQFQRLFNVSQKNGLRYSSRLTATPALQRQRRMLSATAFVHFDLPDNSGMQRLKNAYRLIRRDRRPLAALSELLAAAARPGETIYPMYRFARSGEVYSPVSQYVLGIVSEQEPSPHSRVTLSSTRVDALGVPLADVCWRPTDLTRYTLQTYAAILREELAGIAKLELFDWLSDPGSAWQTHVDDQKHHIGTARMADSPTDGVVDRNLRVHGTDNLFIASSAVFPTGGHSNPTLTMLALTFRLADRLRTTAPGA